MIESLGGECCALARWMGTNQYSSQSSNFHPNSMKLCKNYDKRSVERVPKFQTCRAETLATGSLSLTATSSWQEGWLGNWLFQKSGQPQWIWACSFQKHWIDLNLLVHKLCRVICSKFDVNHTQNKARGLRSWTQPGLISVTLSPWTLVKFSRRLCWVTIILLLIC